MYLIRSMDEIMSKNKKNTWFVLEEREFGFPAQRSENKVARSQILQWLEAYSIKWQRAMPPGMIEGDPGIYALTLPRVSRSILVSIQIEIKRINDHKQGEALLTLSLYRYRDWLRDGGPERLREGSEI